MSADALSKEDTEGTENDLERREKLFTEKGGAKDAMKILRGGPCGIPSLRTKHPNMGIRQVRT
jgi:hypothetical protein